jgi:hypothetical protein
MLRGYVARVAGALPGEMALHVGAGMARGTRPASPGGHASFTCQAQSWTKPRRVVAKVE